jgi:hypothetical protein
MEETCQTEPVVFNVVSLSAEFNGESRKHGSSGIRRAILVSVRIAERKSVARTR